MGRRRLSVELINGKKARCTAYIKRQKCLKKKIDELSTLCGIKVGMIAYGPKVDSDSSELEIFPEDDQTLRELIVSYRSQTSEARQTRTSDVSHYFWDIKKKAQNALLKLRKQNNCAKFPTWDDSYDKLSVEQLREFYGVLSSKLEALMTMKYELMKSGQRLPASVVMDSTYGQPYQNYSYSLQSLFRRSNMQMKDVQEQQPMSSGMASDANLPLHYKFNQVHQELSLNTSSVMNPMRMMLMNCNDYTQFGSASSSKAPYTPLNGMVYFDEKTTTFGMPENMIVNNPMPFFCYYDSTMQPKLQDVPCLMMPGASSQIHASQMDECYEHGDFKLNRQG